MFDVFAAFQGAMAFFLEFASLSQWGWEFIVSFGLATAVLGRFISRAWNVVFYRDMVYPLVGHSSPDKPSSSGKGEYALNRYLEREAYIRATRGW